MTLADDHDRLRNLAERAETGLLYPRSWIPDDKERTIAGRFVRLDEGYTAYGTAKIVVLETEGDEERGVWLLHTVLRNEFKRLRPKPGELVAVTYLGRKKGQSGQMYDAYKVVVDRPETNDWDSLEPEDDLGEEWASQRM